MRVIRFEIIENSNGFIVFSTYNKYCDFNQEIEYQLQYHNKVQLVKIVEEITVRCLIKKFKSLKRVKQKR